MALRFQLRRFATAITCAAGLGFGQHVDEVTPEHLSAILLYIMASSVIWSLGVCAAKASFACFYLRLISDRRWVLVNRLAIVCLLCQGIEQCLYEILQCKPIHKAWTPGVEGTCIPLWWGGFALNLGLDLILFIEPIPIVWSLQLIPVTKKIGIIFMLSLRLLICGIAIIRIVDANKTGPDVTYDLAEPILWSLAEIAALIICPCVPSMRQAVLYAPGSAECSDYPPILETVTAASSLAGRVKKGPRFGKPESTAAAAAAATEGSGNSTSRFVSRHLRGIVQFGTADRTTTAGTATATADHGCGGDLESGAGGGISGGEAASPSDQQQGRPSPHDVPAQHDPASGGTNASPSTPASGSGGDGGGDATATATTATTATTTRVARVHGGGAAGQSQILVTLEIDHDVEEVREQNRQEEQALAARQGHIVPEGWATTSLSVGTAASSRSASPAKRSRIGDGGYR
ncbi:hypothetical protein GGTG_11863 [Gaeumannomyces tritici R3-111a-1]|uniref:Rhodopsin domain-containing protein n=1 Tax=Gaeumannomyces tritici (strain R3-111a-1) TaxID=644352 RepID=J3PED2_GAET3|nr:hypothetical protein GGTG_11863 [Gaeumannomyces tritici R3-111a-1]EJT70840.1 hypothetical protein GGTG_11863 [Gaeumannomyces tritici R3-111a-1]